MSLMVSCVLVSTQDAVRPVSQLTGIPASCYRHTFALSCADDSSCVARALLPAHTLEGA
jgi:hypothetical protein